MTVTTHDPADGLARALAEVERLTRLLDERHVRLPARDGGPPEWATSAAGVAQLRAEIDTLRMQVRDCREVLRMTDSEQVRRLRSERDEARAELERLRAHARWLFNQTRPNRPVGEACHEGCRLADPAALEELTGDAREEGDRGA